MGYILFSQGEPKNNARRLYHLPTDNATTTNNANPGGYYIIIAYPPDQ